MRREELKDLVCEQMLQSTLWKAVPWECATFRYKNSHQACSILFLGAMSQIMPFLIFLLFNQLKKLKKIYCCCTFLFCLLACEPKQLCDFDTKFCILVLMSMTNVGLSLRNLKERDSASAGIRDLPFNSFSSVTTWLTKHCWKSRFCLKCLSEIRTWKQAVEMAAPDKGH